MMFWPAYTHHWFKGTPALLGMGMAGIVFTFFLISTALAGEIEKNEAGGEAGQLFKKSQRYEKCITLARENPTKAYDMAQSWKSEGINAFAPRHCLAVALIAIQNFFDGAKVLESIYEDIRQNNNNPGVTIDILRQTGQAWMLASENERAAKAFTAILTIDPDNLDIRLDRGIVRAQDRRYWDALDDINRVLEAEPERVEALILRANAYRKVRAPELAQEDLEKALALEPRNADALFERALTRRTLGQTAAAKTDLQSVIMLTAGTPLGFSARRALARLEKN